MLSEKKREYYRTHILNFVEEELGEFLSPEQKEFLLDIVDRGIRYAIVSSGRGAGKSKTLSAYALFRIVCFDDYDITILSSSESKSNVLRNFIDSWLRNSAFLRQNIEKSISGEVQAKNGNRIYLCNASETSVRGFHGHDLLVDEVSTLDSIGATEIVKSAIGTISTSPDATIILASTSQYVHGEFLEIWQDAQKRGFKRYQWAIARHIKGETNPELMFGWIPKQHFISKRTLDGKRKLYNTDMWLVEVLGGISLRSGLVFRTIDLDACICAECEECEPTSPNCMLFKDFNPRDRTLGVDWANVDSNAYVVVGRNSDGIIFVLYNEEYSGTCENSVLRAKQIYDEYACEKAIPDTHQEYQNQQLARLGATVYLTTFEEGGQQKTDYVANLRRVVERHLLIIPKKFEVLISQLRRLSFERRGEREKIMKRNDHSVDALMYAISEFYDESISFGLGDYWSKGHCAKCGIEIPLGKTYCRDCEALFR